MVKVVLGEESLVTVVLRVAEVTLLEVVGGGQIDPFEQRQVPMLSQL